MKKVLSVLTAVALTLSLLAGCGSPASSAPGGEASSAPSREGTEGEKLKVGIIQLVEHPSLDEIRTAFLEEMDALGYGEDKVEFLYQNGQNDPNVMNTICQQFVGDEVDAIMAIATNAAQSAAAATSDIPVIFSAVTDPVAAQLLSDPAAPDGNATGTSDAIPTQQIFALADQLTPGIQKYGFIYNLGEVNSVSVIGEAKAYLDSRGIAYEEATVTTSGEVAQAAQALIDKGVGAIFAPIDNTVASAMTVLAETATAAKVPVYVAADSMVNDGGLATVGVNYTNLGKQTAAMTVKVLEGTPVSQLPVEVLDEYSVAVNPDTAAALGVDVSAYLS